MAGDEWAYRSATELLAALDTRETSAVELAEAAVARIERHDGAINAVCVRDFDRARAAAREADAARTRGEAGRRPLLGLPITVKESFQVAGLPSTWGVPAFAGEVAAADALAVTRVKDAGGVVLGLTNVPMLLGDVQSFNDLYGTTSNPFDVGRTSGGSSGGSAAAVAAGYSPLALGSDIGGSLRTPAHFCGVYAHKATVGLPPMRGHTPPGLPVLPGEDDLAVVGPITRTAADLSLLLDVLAGPDEHGPGAAFRVDLPPPRHDTLADHRVLLLDAHPLVPTSAAVRTALDSLAATLTAAGATVTRRHSLLPDLMAAAGLYMKMLMSTIAVRFPKAVYEQIRAEAAGLADDDTSIAAERTRGAVISHRDRVRADIERRTLRERWRALFAEVDVVLAPVTPTPAFPHDHADMAHRTLDIDGVPHPYFDQLALAGVATLPGLPATALPVGRSPEGLPIGVQAIGPLCGDRTTLRFAELVEREIGGFTPPPLS
jgi:amidase